MQELVRVLVQMQVQVQAQEDLPACKECHNVPYGCELRNLDDWKLHLRPIEQAKGGRID